MKIDAITCCVGDAYTQQLLKVLPVWLDTLDTVTIVTSAHDTRILNLEASNLSIVVTDVFTKYGADFNKGAALNFAFKKADPTDWVLHIDSDIDLPNNWRAITKLESLDKRCIYGAKRVNLRGEPDDQDSYFWPLGFFQLWHSHYLPAMRWPLYDVDNPHAGNYDADFLHLWSHHCWRCLPFLVTHQSSPRQNWFGPNSNVSKMQPLLQVGLGNLRMLGHQGYGKLAIPKPICNLCLQSSDDIQWAVEALRICRNADPFLIRSRVSLCPMHGYEFISADTNPSYLKDRLQLCMK